MEKKDTFDTPVLFLIFNRPDLTRIVFDRIREVRPKYLFIGADGPRTDHPEDNEKCESARRIVLDMIDWDCEVKTLFRDENLGCRIAVSQAITWYFQYVQEGIILEDDCLPDKSFFSYCGELLKKYEDNEQIMHIGGCNLDIKVNIRNSYFFTKYNHIWGWATWRKSWELYIGDLSDSDINIKKTIRRIIHNKNEREFWISNIIKTKYGSIDSWDFNWVYTLWKYNGMAILPKLNLVKNIGFNRNATHTKNDLDFRSNLSLNEIKEISHPLEININKDYSISRAIKLGFKKRNLIPRITKK